MKIIATSKNDVICSLSQSEIARLLGFYSIYHDEVRKFIENQGEIDLNGLYGNLYEITRLNKDIQSAKEQFDKMSGILEELSKISGGINDAGVKLN
jgi:hypothetical protein